MSKKSTTPATTADTGSEVVATRFDPFARISLGEWFDRWPELFARRWPESFHDMPFTDDSFRLEQFVEKDGTIVVRGELPGLDPDNDVTVTVDDDRLVIAGEREERHEDKHNGGYRSEFRYGSFKRSIRLPAGAVTDKIVAEYTDGILEVRVPVDKQLPAATTIPIAKK